MKNNLFSLRLRTRTKSRDLLEICLKKLKELFMKYLLLTLLSFSFLWGQIPQDGEYIYYSYFPNHKMMSSDNLRDTNVVKYNNLIIERYELTQGDGSIDTVYIDGDSSSCAIHHWSRYILGNLRDAPINLLFFDKTEFLFYGDYLTKEKSDCHRDFYSCSTCNRWRIVVEKKVLHYKLRCQ